MPGNGSRAHDGRWAARSLLPGDSFVSAELNRATDRAGYERYQDRIANLQWNTLPTAGVYTLDPAHTFAEFTAQHLVVGHVWGRFDSTTGHVPIADDPTLSSLAVSIETASISTHNTTRDEDLRSPRFFDVEKFPTMTFHSTGIKPELEGQWTVEGELTIRDITRPVSLSVNITGMIVDPRGKVRVGIRVHAQAARRDFGLLADLEQESGGETYGKDISISVATELLLQEGA